MEKFDINTIVALSSSLIAIISLLVNLLLGMYSVKKEKELKKMEEDTKYDILFTKLLLENEKLDYRLFIDIGDSFYEDQEWWLRLRGKISRRINNNKIG